MAEQRNALKVGTFTIVAIAVFVAVLIWISQEIGGDMQTVVIHFRPSPSMPTIVAGSAVLVGGQRVGQVVTAELSREGPAQHPSGFFVRVEAEMLSALKLREDCSAVAEGPPLGGDGLVKIDLGSEESEFQGKFIEGSEPGGLGAILAALQGEINPEDPGSLLGQIKSQLDPHAELSLMYKLHQSFNDVNTMTASLAMQLTPAEKFTLMDKLHLIADDVNQTTSQLRREFDAGQPDVLLHKIHLAMDAVNDGVETIARVLRAGETPVSRTLANLAKTSENIVAETDPARTDSMMAHVKRTSGQMEKAVSDLKAVTSTARDLMVLNRENINRLLINFKETSDHMKTGVKYVLRHPWRIFNAPEAQEIKQQAIFDAARSFSEAATRVDDATAQLRALAELHDGNIPLDDSDLNRIRDALESSFAQYRQAEEELWRQLGASRKPA